jgi:hypothetical protein
MCAASLETLNLEESFVVERTFEMSIQPTIVRTFKDCPCRQARRRTRSKGMLREAHPFAAE